MRVPFIDIRAQAQEIEPELSQVVLEILSSGAYVLGKHNQALEQEVAALHGVRYGIAVNSGTDALRIALDACSVGPGDEVLTSAFTFVASVETIVQVGAKPVFVDIEPATFNLDPSKLEAALTTRTKAIMPIHLFGQLANMQAIGEFAKKHGLVILEDAAQAIGNHCSGSYAGSFGKAAGFSFYVTKNLGAAGDGGMILTNDQEVAERCKSLRVHGMGRERYYYDYVGYTSRLDEIQAAILRLKIKKLEAWNAQRARIAQLYLDELRGEDVVLPVTAVGNNHTWHQFTIRSKERDALQEYLRSQEIDSMIYYPVPLHLHEPYKQYSKGHDSLPDTELAAREVLSLPIHQHLTEEQAQHVIRHIRDFSKVPVGAR